MSNLRREPRSVKVIPWLDYPSQQTLLEALEYLLNDRDDVQAAILYGSVARQTARPFDDPDPSDVDVLILFRAETRWNTASANQHTSVSAAIVETINRYPQALQLEFIPTLEDLSRWDESFIANVAHDGIILWQQSELPPALQSLDMRP